MKKRKYKNKNEEKINRNERLNIEPSVRMFLIRI